MTKPNQQNQTPEALPAAEVAPIEWATPQLDRLPIEDTAAAAPNDTADAGIFS